MQDELGVGGRGLWVELGWCCLWVELGGCGLWMESRVVGGRCGWGGSRITGGWGIVRGEVMWCGGCGRWMRSVAWHMGLKVLSCVHGEGRRVDDIIRGDPPSCPAARVLESEAIDSAHLQITPTCRK